MSHTIYITLALGVASDFELNSNAFLNGYSSPKAM